MNDLALSIGGVQIQPPIGVPVGGSSMLATILAGLLNLLFILAGVLAVIFLILAGIRWITSGGDAKAIEAARKQITYAIIGLAVSLLAFFIVNVLGTLLGVKLIG